MPGFSRSMTDFNYLDRMNLNHLPLPRKQHQSPSTFLVLQQPVSSSIVHTSGALGGPQLFIGEERASVSFLAIFQLLGLLVSDVHFTLLIATITEVQNSHLNTKIIDTVLKDRQVGNV